MGMLGANPEALRSLGEEFVETAERVQTIDARISSEVDAVQWFGLDADRFRHAWQLRAAKLRALAAHLEARNTSLRKQADEQDRASAARIGYLRRYPAHLGTPAQLVADMHGGTEDSVRGLGAHNKALPFPRSYALSGDIDGRLSDQGPYMHPDPSWPVDDPMRRRLSRLARSQDPHAVKEYFTELGLDPADADDARKLRELGEKYPHLIGNLEGAPYVARDAANRVRIDEAIAMTEAELASIPPTTRSHHRELLQARLRDLNAIHLQLGISADVTGRRLIEFYPDRYDHVQASVASGNLDTADNVTVFVPGMDVTGQDIQNQIESAEEILAAEVESSPPHFDDSAAITFMNFDTPKGLEVYDNASAIDAAEFLANDLDGLNAARKDQDFQLNIVGHSYGTNVVHHTLAGQGDRFGVDNVFMVGSSGLPEEPRDRYLYGNANQYATESDQDNVAWKGRLGQPPDHPIDPTRVYSFHEYRTSGPDLNGDPTTTHDARTPGGYFVKDSANVKFISERIRR